MIENELKEKITKLGIAYSRYGQDPQAKIVKTEKNLLVIHVDLDAKDEHVTNVFVPSVLNGGRIEGLNFEIPETLHHLFSYLEFHLKG